MFLVLLFFKNDSLLLFHELSFLIKDFLDSFVNSILHLFGFNLLCLFGRLQVLVVALDLLILLVDFELVLHVFLPEVVDLFGLFVDCDFSLCDLIDELLTLALHTGNHFDLVDVFSLEYLALYINLRILISLNHQCFQQNVYLVHVVQFLEVGLKIVLKLLMAIINTFKHSSWVRWWAILTHSRKAILLTLRIGSIWWAAIHLKYDEIAILIN